jgi:deoxyribonucleoside regulator
MARMRDDENRLELLARIALLYYDEHKTQQEISDMTRIARSAISRMLDEAREKGVVQIKVNYPWRTVPALEQALQSEFDLKAARVLKRGDKSFPESLRGVGELAAEYFTEVLTDHSVIGVSWGTLVQQAVQSLPKQSRPNCEVLQLVGGTGAEKGSAVGPLLTPALAERLDCACRLMNAPLITKSAEMTRALMQEPVVRDALERSKEIDIALAGIGALDLNIYNPYRLGYVTAKEVREMVSAGAVGDVCGYHFSIDGEILDIEMNERFVHVSLDVMRRIKRLIGVAGGLIKANAIYGALSGRLVNVLITDEAAAQEVLRLKAAGTTAGRRS